MGGLRLLLNKSFHKIMYFGIPLEDTCLNGYVTLEARKQPGRLFIARAAGRRRVAEALFIFNLTTRGERGRQSSGGELGEGEGWPGGVVGGRSGRRRGRRAGVAVEAADL